VHNVNDSLLKRFEELVIENKEMKDRITLLNIKIEKHRTLNRVIYNIMNRLNPLSHLMEWEYQRKISVKKFLELSSDGKEKYK